MRQNHQNEAKIIILNMTWIVKIWLNYESADKSQNMKPQLLNKAWHLDETPKFHRTIKMCLQSAKPKVWLEWTKAEHNHQNETKIITTGLK